jgi:uncharacterized SAM-binding protein YcdF (DUF218 family)
MLISGVARTVKPHELALETRRDPALFQCCIDLGRESVDTRSNAEEAKRWMDRHRFKSLRLVTSDWHMRRARYEFNRRFDRETRIVPDGVKTEPSFMTLFAEYNKYLLRRVGVWFDI